MKTQNTKFWSIMIVVALVITMTGGYSTNANKVQAETLSQTMMNELEAPTGEIAIGETTTNSETTTGVAETTTKVSETTTAAGVPETTTAVQETTTTVPETTTQDPNAYNLVAHRGYSGYAPENSMPAFEMAIAAGFKTIELDLFRCKPDANGNTTWVISHDNSLKDTMGIDKNITDLTYSEVLSYSYTAGNNVSSYSNLKIVSLPQLIALMQKTKAEGLNITWQIELKYVDDDNYKSYFANEVVAPIKAAKVEDTAVFSSFHYSYLKAIKAADTTLHTWFLSTILDEDALNYAKACKADGISFKGNVNYTTKDMIAKALSEGFKLGVYNINTTVLMGTYYSWGVRMFTTDYIAPTEVSQSMLTGTYNVNAFTYKVDKTSYVYDGVRKLPKVTVSYKGFPLVEGVNYSLSYDNNKNPGTAYVYVSGLNNCISEKKLSFTITVPKVTGFNVTASKTNYIGLSWTKVANATGYIVYKYNYTKKKYEAVKTIKNPATVTTKMKNLTSATKYRFRVKAYVTVDGKTYKSDACSGKTTYTRSAKTSIWYLKRYGKGKKIRVKWKTVPRCTGYTIKVATDKKMKKVIRTYTVANRATWKLKIKKLSKSKTYYVKVRSYLKVGKTTYNGVYTSVSKIKGVAKKK